MSVRKLLLITVGLLLACQMGFAQYGPANAAQLQALAAKASQTPHGLPVVPKALPESPPSLPLDGRDG